MRGNIIEPLLSLSLSLGSVSGIGAAQDVTRHPAPHATRYHNTQHPTSLLSQYHPSMSKFIFAAFFIFFHSPKLRYRQDAPSYSIWREGLKLLETWVSACRLVSEEATSQPRGSPGPPQPRRGQARLWSEAGPGAAAAVTLWVRLVWLSSATLGGGAAPALTSETVRDTSVASECGELRRAGYYTITRTDTTPEVS